MEFEHEEAFKEFNTSYAAMPLSIKTRIQNFEKERGKVYEDPENVDAAAARALQVKSAIIANEIQDFIEKDLAEEEETTNPNNMLSDADKARAKAVGLDENTATITEIEAKEKEIAEKEAADKAAADAGQKEKEEKEASDKAAADAAQKEKEEKEAADKAAADEEAKKKAMEDDEDDIVDGVL